jgi:vacuolar-type H+-ATPase subunit H
MNFSRTRIGTANPISNRFIAAIVATIAALALSVLSTGQWASADSGTTAPDPDPSPVPGAPRHVTARAGDEAAAVAWIAPAGDAHVTGYIVFASPSGITVETTHEDHLVFFGGLTNGVEYTFTVVAFNDAGHGEVSEPSSPVVPEEGLQLDEERLERLREHLRKLARKAKERFRDAGERAREKLEKTEDRGDKRLEKQTDRAHEFAEKSRDRAMDRHERLVERARNWFERFREGLRERLHRAEGTDRYDELLVRTEESLGNAREKLADRIDRSDERKDARIEQAEETARHRIEKAHDRAKSAIDRTQIRLAEQITRLNERVHELLRRLAEAWRDAQITDEG